MASNSFLHQWPSAALQKNNPGRTKTGVSKVILRAERRSIHRTIDKLVLNRPKLFFWSATEGRHCLKKFDDLLYSSIPSDRCAKEIATFCVCYRTSVFFFTSECLTRWTCNYRFRILLNSVAKTTTTTKLLEKSV